MKIPPTKQPWPQHIRDLVSGNVANVEEYSPARNYMETTSCQWLTRTPDSQTSTPTSIDYFLDKSSPSVPLAISKNQNQKTKFDESLENQKQLIGKKIDFHGHIGIIEDIPNENIAWVHFEGEPLGSTRGIKLSTILEKEIPGLGETLTYTVNPAISMKKDAGKYDPTMITIEMLELVSRVREFGAKKYARNNFKITGFKYTRSLAAAIRHIWAFLGGEDNDPESGLSHLGHAICCLEHLIYDTKHHPENDDRK